MNAPLAITDEDSVVLGDLSQSVGFVLRMKQTRAYDQFFREFAETEVRPGEFTVLWVLSLNPGLRQGTLARTLNIKPAHMTKLVQRMVKAGQLTGHVPPEDRRAVELALTKAGRAHLDHYSDRFHAVHRAERVGLTDPEYAQLLTLLSKLTFQETPECP